MITIKDRLSSLLPEHIIESYPKMVDFLSAYLEWIEKKENPAGYIRNLRSNMDIDTATDEFVDAYKKEVLPQIPEYAASDKRLYLKFINDIKQTKGSEESFRLLFRLLYNESIEIYYPKKDILRVSDGKWIKDEIYLYVTNTGNPTQFYENSNITQTRNDGTALGLITNIREINIAGYKYIRLSITDVVGEFTNDFPVLINNVYEEFVYPTVDTIIINDAGTGYEINDVISWPGGYTFSITSEINHNLITDLQVTTTLDKDDIYVEVDGNSTTSFEFDGRRISFTGFVAGQEVYAVLPSVPGYAIVSGIGDNGEIEETRMINAPVGYNLAHTLNIQTEDGDNADVGSSNANFIPVPGRYKNTDGHLSSDKYIRDGDFYQEYSYVVRASRTLEAYADVFKKLVHPAGMKMFGEISIFDIISLTITINDLSRQFVPLNASDINTRLGPLLASVEYFKEYYNPTVYNLAFFDNISMEEIENNPNKSVNFEAPPVLQYLFDGIDVDEAMEASDRLYNIVMFYMPNHVSEYELVNPVWPLPE